MLGPIVLKLHMLFGLLKVNVTFAFGCSVKYNTATGAAILKFVFGQYLLNAWADCLEIKHVCWL